MERMLTLRALAQRLSVSRRRILAWVAAGSFPSPVILPSGHRRWRAADVVSWMGTLARTREDVHQIEQGEAAEWTEPEEATGEATASGPVDIGALPQMAQKMIRVLEDAKGRWMSGEEVAAKMGQGVDRNSGHFTRCVKRLKEAGLVDADQAMGYRLLEKAVEGNEEGNG